MAKKKIDEWHEHIRCLAYASLMSASMKKIYIDADEIFLGTFLYTKEKQFFEVFRKFLWCHDLTDIQEYINDHYRISQDELQSQYVATLQIKEPLSGALHVLHHNNKDIKQTFVSLLYISLEHLSSGFVSYLEQHNIDREVVKNKLNMLLHNPIVHDMGVVAFFAFINKIMKKLHLSLNDISMMQFDTKDSIDSLLDAMEQDFLDEGSDMRENDSAIKTTTSKKDEEKKLTIEFFGTDLTQEARDTLLDPVIGREKEIYQMMYTLLRKTKNNPLLIGEAWVGKTAVVEWLAQKIVSGDVPMKLKNKRMMMLDMGTLLAGTKYRGEFEWRLKAILEEAADPTNNIILFIDEIHTIIWSGNQEGSADAANMLKPLLARGKVKLIGATTFDEYQKHIEKDPALKRRFQEIHINEPSTDDTITILHGIKKTFEDYHGVVISDEAIIQAVTLSKRYILNKQLPDKAIDIIDEAAARKSTMTEKMEANDDYLQLENSLLALAKKIEWCIEKQDYFAAANYKQQEETIKSQMKHMRLQHTLPEHLRPTITKQDIGVVLAEKIGVPSDHVTASEIEKLRLLETSLRADLIGQEEAVSSLVHAMKRSRLSVIQKNKPIASFLFLGPSGVGKTYGAKLLAKHYFGDEKALIRVDMSEFMEKHSVSKLVWSPAWYVGYDEGWTLTESVRRKPYSVILFDEIEKAAPDVLNILLQILDEGHLKDNKGRWIDFKSAVIIMTSNLGSEVFSKKAWLIGFHTANAADAEQKEFAVQKEKVMERVKDWMKPELLNRLDYSIVFKPLAKPFLVSIMQQQLTTFLQQRKGGYEGKLPTFTKKKIEAIIDEIYDPQFGARPIEKYIYEKIEPAIIDSIMK